MKYLFFSILVLLLSNCSKPKTVLICGNHVCVNKTEAEQYFEENLTLEVKIINKKIRKEFNLIELNLKDNQNGKRVVNAISKKKPKENLKILSDKEIKKIKENIKTKKKEKNDPVKIAKKKKIILDNSNSKTKIESDINKSYSKIVFKENVNKKQKEVVDVCTILKECSIDEISKYLLEQGKKKNFPDITTRQ